MALTEEHVSLFIEAMRLCIKNEDVAPTVSLQMLFSEQQRNSTLDILQAAITDPALTDLAAEILREYEYPLKQPTRPLDKNTPFFTMMLSASALDTRLCTFVEELSVQYFFCQMNDLILAHSHFKKFKKWLKLCLSHHQSRAELLRILNSSFDNHPDLYQLTQVLLHNLGLSEAECSQYLHENNSIYAVFAALRKNGFIQIDYVLALFEKDGISKKVLLVIGLMVGSYLLSSLLFPHVLAVLALVIANPLTLPVAGLLLTAGVSIYALYCFFKPSTRLSSRVRDLLLSLANAVVNSIAYIAWWMAGTIMTPVVACLFLMASLIDVAKECLCLLHERIRYQPYIRSENRREHIQRSYNFKQHRNALLVGILAAATLALVMLGWCCLTGAWVTPTAIGLIVAVYVFKTWFIYNNEKIVRHSLQNKLRKIPATAQNYFFSKENSFIQPKLPTICRQEAIISL